MELHRKARLARVITNVGQALAQLEKLVAAVRGQGRPGSRFARAIGALNTLSQKEGIPLAIVGGLGAIHHGYERFTKDIDVVVPKEALDVIIRVAPKYGIKVIWHAPDGWHKLQYGGVDIDVVPEGGKPRQDAPAHIPGPKQLGVQEGADYAHLPGWIETKLGSNRIQDRADVVQVMKKTTPAALLKARKHIDQTHQIYLQRFDELHATAEQEKQQERQRGGPR